MKPYLVGLTGGMAEGKTTCCRFFQELGAIILDVDSIVHSMYETDSNIQKQICTIFGHHVMTEQGINRNALSAIVFYNKEAMKQLTDIVWPEALLRIQNEIKRLTDLWSEKKKPFIIIIEAAVLCQAKWHLLMDHILVVYTQDENLIKQRALKRQPFLTNEALEARLKTSFQARQEVLNLMKENTKTFTLLETGVPLNEMKENVIKCFRHVITLSGQH